ncbi:MAG: hypothetical protein HY709_02160 [Candidatus Latescibacteria bacterium]|nr:hypothetical protein [Candidatus Latescibacterota bacterium]
MVLLLVSAGVSDAQYGPGVWLRSKEQRAKERPEVPQVVSRRSLIGKFTERYVSYAHTGYENYETFQGPRPWQSIYDPLGNFLMGGEELYSWVQQTTTDRGGLLGGRQGPRAGDRYGVFDRVVAIGGEDYRGRAARVIIADGGNWYDEGVITRYSPLVLNQTGLQGIRTDLGTHRGRVSLVAARRYRSHRGNSSENANDSAILLGGRFEWDVGLLTFGSSIANQHLFDFRRDLGGLRGDLHSSQSIPAVLAVRVSDDSREDGRGGPVVLAVRVYVNDRPKPDIPIGVIRQSFTNDFTAVGRTTTRGEFRRDPYYDADLKRISDEYQGLETPIYADYFYFRDYLKDPSDSRVKENTNLSLLTQALQEVSLGEPQRADGDDYLMYYIDLEGEPYVRSVRVEFLMGNDYRVDIAPLNVVEPTEIRYQRRYDAPFFETVLRAPGNVQDMSNLRWVSVNIGSSTAQTLYGADVRGNLRGLEIRGEFARGVTWYRYPDGVPGQGVVKRGIGPVLRDWNGAWSAIRDEAYYLTLHRESDRFGFGAEVFSIGPNYNTQMRLKPGDSELSYNPRYLYQQVKNATTFLDLIEDNDDRDAKVETVLRGTLREPDRAVFPGLDANNDGVPDKNRNLNEIPDFAEPFLMYDVDPNEYDWGLDLNNNGEIDLREDDRKPDLPYDKDLGGVHIFGRANVTEHGAATLGVIDADQIAGAGVSDVRYGRLAYLRVQPRLGAVRLEYELKRVRDTVPNDVFRWSSAVGLGIAAISPINQELFRLQRFAFVPDFVKDPLEFRNSLVNRFYLEARVTRIPRLHIENKVKLDINRQRAIEEAEGVPQPADRIDVLTLASKVDYTWEWGRLSVTPAAKFRLLRRTRERFDRPEVDERTFMPILKVNYRLTDRTFLKAGAQGFPFLKYRVTDLADRRNSFRQRTYLIVLSNLSKYAGYNLSTNIGMNIEERLFSDPFRAFENAHFTGAFVRVFLGFEESTLY